MALVAKEMTVAALVHLRLAQTKEQQGGSREALLGKECPTTRLSVKGDSSERR